MQQNAKKPVFIADKANCTYWWHISFNPDQNVKEMTGYSKFQGMNEAASKDTCLMSKIEMLYKNGYFHRSRVISIYKRIAPLPNKDIDELILAITPESIAYFGDSFYVQRFLESFKLAVENGNAPAVNLRPLQPRTEKPPGEQRNAL